MNESNLKIILNEYEKKRIYKIDELENKKKKLYEKLPRLEEIDKELSSLSISTAKSLLKSNDPNLITNFNDTINKLKAEKKNILKSIGKDESYLSIDYDCKLCNDTGYITENFQTEKCNCLKQKIFDLEYNKSNILNLSN